MPAKKTSSARKTTKKTSKKKTALKQAVAKKAVKKVAKKTTKKRVSKKLSPGGRTLVCADDKTCFWTTDGQVLRDLQELNDALNVMSESVFKHHVTKEKNDFATWIEHVLLDAECAAALVKSRKPHTASRVIVSHLRYYSN